jgi:PBSX family phage terminase large subunit
MLNLSPKQKDFYNNSTAKINVAHGAVRSSKTFIVNLRWLKYIRHGPPGTLLMSGKTKESLRENVLEDLFKIVGEESYNYNVTTGILHLFGRKIECKGADKVDSEGRIRGRTYAGWYADEITIHHKSFVKQAIARCSVPDAQIFWTTNPDHPKHHIKTDFIDNKEMLKSGMLKHWHFLLADNISLTPDYKAMLEASFAGVFYLRNIKGLWMIAEGLVYTDYDEKRHNIIRKEVNRMIDAKEFKEYIAGTDFGITAPMTGLLYGVTKDDRFIQIDEFYQTKRLTGDLGRWYLMQEQRIGKKINFIYCDSAEPDRIIELRKMGLRARDANKEINAGLNTVMVLFKSDRLLICSETCPETVNELLTYRFPEPDDPKFKKDAPLDEDNHSMDAKRYALHTYLSKPIITGTSVQADPYAALGNPDEDW